jgi:hypothetical protein
MARSVRFLICFAGAYAIVMEWRQAAHDRATARQATDKELQ